MTFRPHIWFASGLIRIYQLTLSPIFFAVGVRCRYAPTCSQYTLDAMRRHGFWAGGWMGLARLSRCQPWGACGHDPVPEVTNGAWYAPWRYGRWR
ncbi:hypothetical protein GCM10009069_23770 [Algimonas arctica]|uniref:Putative membrane protein insertion efficiency factor n=1 Tax=Algimonas arctica TaxID=1479486 RepID=A0A8J3CTD5_9PROT|nr:membrane protein insertion efficiency factor YidD [Algimonas arctica]GHB00187.1 hypothetical protein GCM10009069_23770 [Algimonas arctica]